MEQEKKRIKAFTHSSLEDIFKSARKAILDFAKPLIALLKVSDWDIDQDYGYRPPPPQPPPPQQQQPPPLAMATTSNVSTASVATSEMPKRGKVSFACWALHLPAIGQSDLHGLGTYVACNGKEAKVVACRYHDKTHCISTPYRASSLAAAEVEVESVEDT
ncbi:hypothetical protein Adt_10608 [Abeliophyllum distichum]|uniref:Uncharacterized protein n=1 Tax=Abeliophyllum distichum TaxID=126358 RepID=A0ABD1UKH4_9LAMI